MLPCVLPCVLPTFTEVQDTADNCEMHKRALLAAVLSVLTPHMSVELSQLTNPPRLYVTALHIEEPALVFP